MGIIKLQTNIWVSLLLVVVAFHAYIRLDKEDCAGNVLKQAMTLDIVLLILEVMGTYFSGKSMIQYRQIHKYVIMCIFLLIPNMLVMAPRFLLGWIEKTARIKYEVPKCCYLPMVINASLTFLTIWTGWLGYINEKNEYIRGKAFGYVLMMIVFYIGYTVFLLLKYKKEMVQEHFYIGCGVISSIIVAVGMQIWKQSILTIWSTIGMLCVCGYIFIIYYDFLHDPLTGIENCASYMSYIRLLQNRKHTDLAAISIDLDGFKDINDTYGHSEGDNALIEFSKLLQKGIEGAKKVIRMGGDEFLIFLKEDDELKIQQQILSLKKCVEQYNANSDKEYFLDFSYGVAFYDDEDESIEDFVSRIDQLMYAQKNRKKYEMKLEQPSISLPISNVDDLKI